MRILPQRAAILAASLALATTGVERTGVTAPIVSIKARTAVELEPIRREDSGITISGRVVDRFTREAVPHVDVSILFDGAPSVVNSGHDGLFYVRFNDIEGTHNLEVVYEGDRHFAPSSYEVRDFDVGKNPLTLAVDASRVVDYGNQLEVTVRAGSGTRGVSISAELSLGDADADKLTHSEFVTTDESGRGTCLLDKRELGKPGRKQIEVYFAGDRNYDAAKADTTFLLVTGSSIVFSLRETKIEFESRLRGDGKVIDDDGGPIDKGPVALFIEDLPVARTTTKADGSFSFSVRASEIGTRSRSVQVKFEPTRAWRRRSHTGLVSINVAEPKPLSVSYTLAAFAATAFALVAFIGLRTQPWKRWKWLQRWRKTKEEEPERSKVADAGSTPIQTGLRPARPSLVSTLRRANDSGFTGVVRNAVNGRPICGGSVAINSDEHGLEVADTQEHGSKAGYFAFEKLGASQWSASVSADGFVSEQFVLTIPHHGELRGVRIDLLPVRERIFAMYGEIAKPLLPNLELWCIWTPRQVFDHVRMLCFGETTMMKNRPPALAELTDFVEEAYFSQRTPNESVLEDTRERIAAARTESASFTSSQAKTQPDQNSQRPPGP